MVAQINRIKRKIRMALAAGLILVVSALPAFAQNLPPVISDDETESLLHQIVSPLFQAADIPFRADRIYILSDNSLNAFVTAGNYMFVNTGTFLEADNVNQISGVLAHETGHIKGGHIAKQQLKLNNMNKLMVASLLAAGATAAASGRADAAMAVLLGSNSSMLTNMMRYQLEDERSADESAVEILRQTKQSPVGLRDFMKKIQKQNLLGGYEENPYFRTHPLSTERLNFFEKAAANSKYNSETTMDSKFKMVKAKLAGFLLPPERVWKLYPQSARTPEALYAHAILYHRAGRTKEALQTLDQLAAKDPQNPFIDEMRGQFLFESGRVSEAVTAYAKALKKRPNSLEMKFGWAQAALEAPHDKKTLQKIITTLNQIQLKRPNVSAWMLLARAYEENAQKAAALYASAAFSYALDNKEVARRQIAEAEKQNPSPEIKLKLHDLKALLDKKD